MAEVRGQSVLHLAVIRDLKSEGKQALSSHTVALQGKHTLSGHCIGLAGQHTLSGHFQWPYRVNTPSRAIQGWPCQVSTGEQKSTFAVDF